MSAHFIIVCSCGKRIGGCRCPGPGKAREERKDGCLDCRKKLAAKEICEGLMKRGNADAAEIPAVNVSSRYRFQS